MQKAQRTKWGKCELTGDDDLLGELDALPPKRRESSRDDKHSNVGRTRCHDVARKVERRRETDSLGSSKDVEDLDSLHN